MAAFHPRAENLPSEFAVFPLTGAFLLPRGKLPLNIFESRYLAMVEDSLASGRMFGMIQPDANASGPVTSGGGPAGGGPAGGGRGGAEGGSAHGGSAHGGSVGRGGAEGVAPRVVCTASAAWAGCRRSVRPMTAVC